MIKNDSEYNFTSSLLESFNDRRAYLIMEPYSQEIEIEISGIDAIINDLRQQLEQYKAIKEGRITFKKIESIKDISEVIVGKRLQLDVSQAELARQLGITTDKYVNLENDDFYGIDLELFNRIIGFLELKNPNHIFDRDYSHMLSTIESNVKNLKLRQKLFPIDFKQIKDIFRDNPKQGIYYIEKIIELFKKVFSIQIEEAITESQIKTNIAVAFKHKTNVDENNLTITTGYAAYIARILTRQMSESTDIEADPIAIRKSIIEKYGAVTLDTCLDFIWGLNTAVIPLNIKGSFHGACFDFKSIKAIVLSQQYKSISRWKFDLLHEFYHSLTMNYTAYIEKTDIMDQFDEEEKKASEFACYVIFGQEMDSLLQMIIEKSDSQIERIKSNIITAAKEYGINRDDLANYTAFRISKGLTNFWGVAENLQTDKRDPVNVLLQHLYKNISINEIDSFELETLQYTFNQEMSFFG